MNAPTRQPIRCIKCWDKRVILTRETHPETYEPFWRYTCLDCKVAWPQDQHGGDPDEYTERR